MNLLGLLPKGKIKKIVYPAIIIGLALFATCQGISIQKNKKAVKEKNVVEVQLDSLRLLIASEYVHIDNAPKGEVITKFVKIENASDSERLSRYWKRWKACEALVQSLLDSSDNMTKEILAVKLADTNLNDFFAEITEAVVEELPTIRTIKESHEEDHDLIITTDSKGQLIAQDFSLKVRPKILTTTKTNYVTKQHSAGAHFGLAYNDLFTSEGFGIKRTQYRMGLDYNYKFLHFGSSVYYNPMAGQNDDLNAISGIDLEIGILFSWK